MRHPPKDKRKGRGPRCSRTGGPWSRRRRAITDQIHKLLDARPAGKLRGMDHQGPTGLIHPGVHRPNSEKKGTPVSPGNAEASTLYWGRSPQTGTVGIK